MRRLALLVALMLAPAAAAGGWATVQLGSLPTDVEAGQAWKVELTVLQHGRTPLNDVQPIVRIRNGDGDVREFAAVRAGKPGAYRAEVVFPAAGTWTYEIWDGFSQTHTYKPVEVAGTAAAGGGSGFPATEVGIGAALALVLAAALVLLLRRQRPSPRPVPSSH